MPRIFQAFLDPVLRQRNVVVFTEWHAVPQHNAKVPRNLLERALGNICTVNFLPSTPTSLNYQLSMTAVKRP